MTKRDLFLTAYHSFSMNSQVFTIWVCRIQGMNHKPVFFFCVFCLICYFSDALFASLHVSRLFLRQFQTRPPGVGFNSWLICFVLTLVICSGSGLLSQRQLTGLCSLRILLILGRGGDSGFLQFISAIRMGAASLHHVTGQLTADHQHGVPV